MKLNFQLSKLENLITSQVINKDFKKEILMHNLDLVHMILEKF